MDNSLLTLLVKSSFDFLLKDMQKKVLSLIFQRHRRAKNIYSEFFYWHRLVLLNMSVVDKVTEQLALIELKGNVGMPAYEAHAC